MKMSSKVASLAHNESQGISDPQLPSMRAPDSSLGLLLLKAETKGAPPTISALGLCLLDREAAAAAVIVAPFLCMDHIALRQPA